MTYIYIAFVDTPGIFASLIHFFLKQKYIHVVVSMDEQLNEAYSVGRRNPFIPLFAGFEREDKEKIVRAFPTADYMVCRLECTEEQKQNMTETLHADYKKRFGFHYTVLGLPFILMNRPFYRKNKYTCSSYIARLLEESGIRICDKHFSIVTPKDFYEYKDKEIVFEGRLKYLTDAYQNPERNTAPVYE